MLSTWVAVVPVKPLGAAKTRLRGAVPEPSHAGLVLAMARDTVAATPGSGMIRSRTVRGG